MPADRSEDDYWLHRRTPAHLEFRAARELLLRLRLDHDAAVAAFRWPRPDRFNWALEWFDVVADGNDSPALVLLDHRGEIERTVSFAAMSAGSDNLAVELTERGVRRGERVLIVLGTRVELWEAILACLKIGAVAVPHHGGLSPETAADRVRRGRIPHALTTPDFPPVPLPGLRLTTADWPGGHRRFHPTGPTPAADPALCYFTSGTTARPKLVAHTHSSYPIGHLSGLYWNGLLPGDRHLNISAPGWAKHSWSSLFVPWNAEATVYALPDGPLPDAALPALLASHAVTSFCAPPSAWQALRPHLGSATPRLREATSAGEPLDPALYAEVLDAWDVRVRDGYGQTETTALIGTTPGLTPRPGRIGRPLPGYRIVLAADGEVCVDLSDAPAGMMAGYADDPERTAAAFADGRYGTGDLGECDADGWYRIDGRRDDVFKSFDRRVSPYEVEAVLRTHPAVAEVAVIPEPHPTGGQAPHALVVLRPAVAPGAAPTSAALLAHAARHLPPELRPHTVTFVDRLARTASGKIIRTRPRS